MLLLATSITIAPAALLLPLPPLAQALHANDLANSFMAFNTNYADSGLFGVHVSSENKEALDDAAFCVMQELQGLIYDPKAEDVVRAKQALKSSLPGVH